MSRVLSLPPPSPRQREFLAASTRYVGYGGARGGGKSWAVQAKAVLLALRYPGIRMLLVRSTLPDLRKNHITKLVGMCHDIARYNKQERLLTFCNGSTLQFDYCASESDTQHFQGQEYDVVFIDEGTQLTEDMFVAIDATIRGTNGFPKRMYVTCNPGGRGHEWVKRLFITREYRAGERPENYTFIRALVTDNHVLMQTMPEYYEWLKSLPDGLREAWLNGDWDSFVGQYFPEWDRERVLVAPMTIPPGWMRFRSLDYGMDCTCCLWWAVDFDGCAWIYRELWQPGLILSDAAKEITAMTPDAEKIRYTAASPDLWNRRQETGRSGAEIMTEAGLRGLVPANAERVPGWRAVREYLKPIPSREGMEICRLRIFSNLKHAAGDLPKLQYDRTNTEDAASEPHDITHAPEAIRYGIMSRPQQPARDDTPHYNFESERRLAEKSKSGIRAPAKSFIEY